MLHDQHPWLGAIPGPLAAGVIDDVIWVAGGGRGSSSVLRFGPDGWHALAVGAHGLRAILPLSATRALVVGEYGYCARVDADGDPLVISTATKDCLFAIARHPDRGLVITGDHGVVFAVDAERGTSTVLPSGVKERIAALHVGRDGVFVSACVSGLYRGAAPGTGERIVATTSPLTAIACAGDGTLGVVGDRGQLYFVRDGAATRIQTGLSANLDAIAWHAADATFVAGGEGGRLIAVSLAGEVTALPPLEPARAVTAIVPWRGGVVVGAWEQVGPPYEFRGTLAFRGDTGTAPALVREPPRQPIPARRERTVALDVTTFLGASDGELISMEEARRRLPDIAWPDQTNLAHVRFFAGHVRVDSTKALLDRTESAGYAVAIAGSLVVDGVLDAVAGGDGYDSVLVVDGDVWAESAIFRYGIKAVIRGVLELASVMVCSHGDDGGDVHCRAIRAQVVAYTLYFPPPDAELDCLCVGDESGDDEFPPDRSAEVFVPEVLDDGVFDAGRVAAALRAGRPVLR